LRRSAPLPGRVARPLLIPAVLGGLVLAGPLIALLVRAPWGRMIDILLGPVVPQAAGISLGTAAAATGICVLVGVPLAAVLAAADTWPAPLRRLIRALVVTPLVLPPVVCGIALLLLLGRTGLLGAPLLQAFGITIPFSTASVVIAQAFVGLPFLVLAVEGSLRGVDPHLQRAAAVLGATPLTVFLRVTLPLAGPGLLAGSVLSFARALGEFGATITFAGSLPGVTETLPIAAYLSLSDDLDSAIGIAVILVLVSVVVLVSLRDRWLTGLRP
jgi:molybdate transport system permease protein